MLFPEEDSSLLKAWIVKRLENTSDADSDVLADYVLALLRHEGTPREVRSLCEAEIPDFLGDDTSSFLDDVFSSITYKSYHPGAPPPPPPMTRPAALPPPATAPSLPSAHLTPAATTHLPSAPRYPAAALSAGAPPFNTPRGNSRKRSYQERGDVDVPPGSERGFGPGRQVKQPRRFGGPGAGPQYHPQAPGGFPSAVGHGLPPAVLMNMPVPDFSGRLPEPNPQFPGMTRMDADAGPAFPQPGLPPGMRGQAPKRRGRCWDYDRQGFCARGINCMFEHGPAVAGNASPLPMAPQLNLEGYDPTNAALVLPSSNGHMNVPQALPLTPPFALDARPGMAPMDNRQGRLFKKGRGGRSQLSAEGPVHDKTRTTIVVENIPEENFTEDNVRGFFSQFGNIVDISMQPYKRLALVKYDKWHSANQAYKSPKVVFNNRFVRIYWAKDENATSSQKKPAHGGLGNGIGTKNGDTGTKEATNGHGGDQPMSNGGPATDPEIDMEEFHRKQTEAQKAFEEKKRKKEEVERMRLEVEQRQKELLARQEEEKQKLLAKLAAAQTAKADSGENAEREGDSPSPEITFAKTSTGGGSAKPPAASAHTEALRAQLAALEAEAKSMGINPNETSEDGADSWGAQPFRGGARGGYRGGRGRGAPFRSRGFPPRGFRGGFRGGRGGGHHAAYSAYSIDNRPRKVAITGVDFTEPEKDEKLRHYLLGIGEFTDIQTAAAVTRITFADRRTAETFFYGPAGSGKQIPGVDGQVELAWVPNSPSEGSALSTGGAASAATNGHDAADLTGKGVAPASANAADDDVVMSSTRDEEAVANVDYEDEVPADDQDWDVA